MKPTSRNLSWAFVIIMLAGGIFYCSGNTIDAQTTARPAGQAEATEIRISGKLPDVSIPFWFRIGGLGTSRRYSVVIHSPDKYMAKYQQVNALEAK